jgi:hypothetical protein
MQNNNTFLTAKQYAEKYNITKREAIHRCTRNRVHYYKVGREYRIEDKDLVKIKPGRKTK